MYGLGLGRNCRRRLKELSIKGRSSASRSADAPVLEVGIADCGDMPPMAEKLAKLFAGALTFVLVAAPFSFPSFMPYRQD